jgi:hypothetical protein
LEDEFNARFQRDGQGRAWLKRVHLDDDTEDLNRLSVAGDAVAQLWIHAINRYMDSGEYCCRVCSHQLVEEEVGAFLVIRPAGPSTLVAVATLCYDCDRRMSDVELVALLSGEGMK